VDDVVLRAGFELFKGVLRPVVALFSGKGVLRQLHRPTGALCKGAYLQDGPGPA
jgi:hypothetical protein